MMSRRISRSRVVSVEGFLASTIAIFRPGRPGPRRGVSTLALRVLENHTPDIPFCQYKPLTRRDFWQSSERAGKGRCTWSHPPPVLPPSPPIRPPRGEGPEIRALEERPYSLGLARGFSQI